MKLGLRVIKREEMLRSFENLRIYIYIFISFYFFKIVSGGCQFQEHNLEILSTNSPWLAWNYPHGRLEISFCKPLDVSNCEKNASICYDGNRTFANFNENSILSIVQKTEQFSLQVEGNECSKENKANAIMIIYFKCGKSLGIPKFLSGDICRIVLEWQTTAACREGSELAQIETTKCYGYNSKQLFINLGALDDEYEAEVGGDNDDIDDDNDVGIENINGMVLKLAVCRNMNSGESCPGFGACLMKNGSVFSLGKISKEVAVNADDSMTITYVDSESTMPGCKDVTTTINFFCPERGIGSKPLLLPSSRCNFSIHWETEAACPAQSTTTDGCVLRSSKHVVDLTSLRSDEPTKLTAEDENGDSLEFQLHVCSDKLIACGEKHSSACQRNLNNSNVKSIGNFFNRTLRYSDGALQMTMDGGEPCGTGFYRNTIINFHCDPNNSVTFDFEDKCSYFFNWKTPLACLTPSISCSLKSGTSTFDLSGLTRTEAEVNWRTSDNSFFLNVCRGLTQSDPLSRNCSSGAICWKDGDMHVSYGKRMRRPTLNKERGAIQLDYFDGDACSPNERFNASLLLFCDPNVVNSQPYLVRNDSCHIDLEWHSSLACGSGHSTGRNCLVKDLMTGLQFDLSPLRLDLAEKSWYKVETSEYNYFINICGPLKNTPCSQADAGVCQVSKKNAQIVHSTGRWSDELHYTNGLLRLTYKNGDDYHSDPPVPRHTDVEFVCNSRAGLGEPLFVTETNRTYKFLWHTVLACSNNLDKCSSFVGDGQTFDLSFLVQQGSRQNWQMTLSLDGRSYKLFLNLCRSLLIGPETRSCDPLHSACLIPSNNNETVISLGRSLRQPFVKPGVIILTYERGSACQADQNSSYSLELRFHCSKTNAQSKPSSFEKISQCKFAIDWYTSSACPVAENAHNNVEHNFNDSSCIAVLDQSHQTFDITKFRGQTFNANSSLGSYKISLCGESSECGPGMVACKMDGEKVTDVVKTQGRKMTITADGSPQLQLQSDKMKFLINFKCDLSTANESLTFLETHSDWLLFSFSTPLACFGRTISCQVYDESGNKYDLEPLAKLTGSWRAVNPFGDFCDFNLCRPLLLNDVPACRSVGSCLRKKTGEAMNGGLVSNLLEVTLEGSLRITYSGGEPCHGGEKSTLIMLKCSSVGHEPLLLSDVDDCEALVQWETPFACPNKVSHAMGKNCQVRHPTYSTQVFDLSELRESKDYEIDFDIGKFLIRVCKEIQNNEQCKEMKAGACLISAGEAFNMGASNDLLEYRGGRLVLNYSAALDDSGKTRLKECTNGISTEIEFKCEHDNSGITSGPIYISGSCHRKFEWVTSLACFKYRRMSCKVKDKNGIVFDLSPLMLHDSNYEVDGDGTKFIINVCTTLVLTEGNYCPPNSAACKIKEGTSLSIGSLPTDDGDDRKGILSIENNKVRMVYKGDGEFSTVVYFICDPLAPETSTPTFLLKEGDTFIFTWHTRLMCTNNTQDRTNSCSVLDPMTGHLFDLSPIRGTHEFQDYGRKFNVSICTCHPDGQCPAGQSIPWLLTYEHGTIVLRYSGGQSCSEPSKVSSTVVSIVCPSEGEEEVKQFELKNENCLYVFRWKNKLACRKELKCLVQGSGFNLSPLVRHDGSYMAEVSVGGVSKALINVCAHLPPETGCNSFAAVCIEKGGRHLSGGSVKEEPKYDATTKEVSLTYSDGDKCSDRTWSSKIIFKCSQTSDANPKLLSVDENTCLITFTWNTEFTCQKSRPLTDSSLKDCMLKLDNDTYDFRNLSTSLETQKVRSNRGSVEIRLCSDFQGDVCGSSAVCLFNLSAPIKGFGVKSNMKILKEGKDVKITYAGKTCEALSTVDLASLVFICDTSRTTPSIEIIYETNCSIIINIKTSFACSSVNSSIKHTSQAPNQPEEPIDVGHGHYATYVIAGVIVVCILFIVAGFLIHRKRRNQRGYEPADVMHYSRDYEAMNSPLLQGDDRNETGLQNSASDDDLML